MNIRPTFGLRCSPGASPARAQRGVGLVEVLVSVLILGIGMLGIAAMQAMALRYGQSSLESSQAVVQTYSITEAMRANAANAAGYNTGGVRCAANMTGNPLVVNDVNAWITSLKDTMGSPGDTTTCGGIAGCPGACVITVQWDDSRSKGRATGSTPEGSNTRTITTRTSI